MGILSLFSAQSPAHIWFVTLFSGAKRIGQDSLGNTYYEASPRKGYKRNRRWVIYKGEVEASRVPPEWHGWLHYQTDEAPSADQSFRRNWQKPYIPNETGTDNAYRPPGHILEGGKRDKATGDYKAWTPPQ
ncbi:MAG: NADH:ubiquinone oxidoreductase subunit NDUFA12 [Micavibrio aeruginosavorus]|uniref:NADH:ubiquinone oxidoreductase subunit NDUFA12 n=1 Tax=Micavibrio aeruginosavorus TaxID=349221 RepID=A0A2W5FQ94_9BACT|nr:MAG: NADH:ubiquinone oxidoreductase subunit NDUFA12 [Micavibrio aeruginosavorus]